MLVVCLSRVVGAKLEQAHLGQGRHILFRLPLHNTPEHGVMPQGPAWLTVMCNAGSRLGGGGFGGLGCSMGQLIPGYGRPGGDV